MRIIQLATILSFGLAVTAVSACDDASGSGGSASTSGSSVASTNASTSTSNASSTSTGTNPANCVALTDKSSCEAAGCIYQAATLYPAMGADPPTCDGGSPVSVCTFYVLGPMQSYTTWSRDSAVGREVVVLGVTDAVAGFENCTTGSSDPCTCFASQ